jgi:hypothetical protein
VPPDSVQCTRTVKLRTLHLRVSQAALRYNSPDCPVCQAEQRLPAQRSTATDTYVYYSARRSQSNRQRRTGQYIIPVRCGTGLSGATRRQSSNGRTLTVGWRGWRIGQRPVAHRTVQCAHRQQPPPTVVLVVEGYKYPPTTSTPTIQAFNTLHSIQEQ